MSEVTEYPRPKDSTVKLLYATAFRCAHENCQKPLYGQDNETGDRFLNSRVAHIHARRQGGPRWKEMDPEENRSPGNLVLMCIEHSYEIDDPAQERKYTPDLLRAWKQAQLDERARVERSWDLTDAEVAEAVAASFDVQQVAVVAGAPHVLALARVAGVLVQVGRRERDLPLREALAWKATRDRARAGLLAWDSETGESLYAEPSRMERDRHRAALFDALRRAQEGLVPHVDEVMGELGAIRAAYPELDRWSDWIEDAIGALLVAAGRWPDYPQFEDDQRLENSFAELNRAVQALTATWRGQPADQPPARQVVVEQAEDPVRRALREHNELLERARPYRRVKHRPLDEALYDELVKSTSFAVAIPPVPSLYALALEATANAIAAVGRNADDATFERLLVQAAGIEPLAVAASVLYAIVGLARVDEHADREGQALSAVKDLLEPVSWDTASLWSDNLVHGRWLLSLAAHVTSVDATRAKLEAALERDTALLELILVACGQWTEACDDEWRVVAHRRQYDSLPTWFPADRVVTEIRRKYPDLIAADRWSTNIEDREVLQLAAQVLHLGRAAGDDRVGGADDHVGDGGL